MSGIYGLLRLDGAPVQRNLLSAMGDAMAYYGPDGRSEWVEGEIAMGRLLLQASLQDAHDAQPVASRRVVMVVHARLDSRDELLRKLAVPAEERDLTPDSKLAYLAYCRWGEGCHAHLDGDWQFAAWDPGRRSLLLARDHHGNTAMYYYVCDRFFAFASSQKALFALPEVARRPDLIKVAQVLTSWHGEGWRSPHLEVHRLPPAHMMLVPRGNRPKCWRYWFPERLVMQKRRDEREYLEEFLGLYRGAVRSRLRSSGETAATLSGGLDSSSVAALAAEALAERGKRLLAFTSTPCFGTDAVKANRTGDEYPLAAAVAQRAGNIDHVSVPCTEGGVVAALLKQLQLQDGPVHGAANMYWIHAIMREAVKRGAKVLLTGQCGNGTVSFAGEGQFYQLLKRREIAAAISTFFFSDATLPLAIRRQLLKPVITPFTRSYRRHFAWKGMPWSWYSAIAPAFARDIGLYKLMDKAGHDPTFDLAPWRRRQLDILKIGTSTIGATWHEIGAGFGIQVLDPTVDRKLVEFCLTLPDLQYRRQGQDRLLIRTAMKDVLPVQVLHNKNKGLQASDLGYRVRAEMKEFRDTLTAIENSHLASYCIDVDRLKALLTELDMGVTIKNNLHCDYILTRSLAVGAFLSTAQ